MATKSFLRNVNLRGTKQCQSFIRALEQSKSSSKKQVTYSRTVTDLDKEQIKQIFGEK